MCELWMSSFSAEIFRALWQDGPKNPPAHVSQDAPAKLDGHSHVPLVVHVPADEQGVGHEEDCNAIRLRDEVVEKGELDGNWVKSFMESHTINCPDDELVEKAAHRPFESIREFKDITWRVNEAFVGGNENDPPGPEKLALGNVRSGAF
jgi:hypothetical protein